MTIIIGVSILFYLRLGSLPNTSPGYRVEGEDERLLPCVQVTAGIAAVLA
jgi:hypothetical protein